MGDGTTGETGPSAQPNVAQVRLQDRGNVIAQSRKMVGRNAEEVILNLFRVTTTSVQVWMN